MFNYIKYAKYLNSNNLLFYKTSNRYFKAKLLHHEIAQSNKYSNTIFNRLTSKENAYYYFTTGDKNGDFHYSALIIFILQKMADRENAPVNIKGTLPSGKEIYMPNSYREYMDFIDDITKLKVSFLVGEDKTEFTFSVDNFFNIVKVSTSQYHPENLSPANIFDLLNFRINGAIRCFDLYDENF